MDMCRAVKFKLFTIEWLCVHNTHWSYFVLHFCELDPKENQPAIFLIVDIFYRWQYSSVKVNFTPAVYTWQVVYIINTYWCTDLIQNKYTVLFSLQSNFCADLKTAKCNDWQYIQAVIYQRIIQHYLLIFPAVPFVIRTWDIWKWYQYIWNQLNLKLNGFPLQLVELHATDTYQTYQHVYHHQGSFCLCAQPIWDDVTM